MTNNLAQTISMLGTRRWNNRVFQYGLIHAVHARASTTLQASAAAGANQILTSAAVTANSILVVTLASGHKTGPLPVQSATGTTSPYSVVLSGPLLTIALVSGTSYGTLYVTAVPVALVAGSVVTLVALSGSTQSWTLSAPTAAGATSLPVFSQNANANYATMSLVTPAGGLFPVGRQLPGAASNGAAVMTVPTIDVYLDGSHHVPNGGQKTSAAPFLTIGVRYLSTYTPVVGHTALILQGGGLRKSDRVAIGRLA